MITGSCTARSKRQAAPESASHVSNRSTAPRETKKATGIATHKLRHSKQSISLPTSPLPKRARNRTTRSAGPSSFSSEWVLRQDAREADTQLGQNSAPL